MEIGIVKFFEIKRCFGFIATVGAKGPEEIFFHLSDHESFETDDAGRVTFSGCQPSRKPKKGDIVVFRRTLSGERLKASPWGFRDDQKVLCNWANDEAGFIFAGEICEEPNRQFIDEFIKPLLV